MRDVTAVDARWLVEFAPKFYKTGNPTKLRKQKKNIRLEPLYNRYEVTKLLEIFQDLSSQMKKLKFNFRS